MTETYGTGPRDRELEWTTNKREARVTVRRPGTCVIGRVGNPGHVDKKDGRPFPKGSGSMGVSRLRETSLKCRSLSRKEGTSEGITGWILSKAKER